MMFFVHTENEDEVGAEEAEEEDMDAALADDLLDELDPVDDELEDALTGGFGEVPEEEEKALDRVIEKGEAGDEDEEGAEDLEEDAEDVDFDRFDDVDDL